jgi:tetratricopeptide (TPR) repeat protein
MEETFSPQELEKEAKRAYKKKDFLSAAEAFQASAEGFSQNGLRLEAAEMLNNASVAYLQANQPESALEAALDTDKTFSSAGDQRREAIALGNQAAAYEALGEIDAATQAYQTSADLLKEIGDQELRPAIMQSLAAIQMRRGQQMEALFTMQAGLEGIENPGFKQKLLKKILRSPFSYFNRLS